MSTTDITETARAAREYRGDAIVTRDEVGQAIAEAQEEVADEIARGRVGSGQRWVFGPMDDDPSQRVERHIEGPLWTAPWPPQPPRCGNERTPDAHHGPCHQKPGHTGQHQDRVGYQWASGPEGEQVYQRSFGRCGDLDHDGQACVRPAEHQGWHETESGGYGWYRSGSTSAPSAHPSPTPQPVRVDSEDEPASDPVGTVRVHPDDDPADPAARRSVLTDGGYQLPWNLLTGRASGRPGSDWQARSHNEIGVGAQPNGARPWPRQSLADLAYVLGHDVERERTHEALTAVARALGMTEPDHTLTADGVAEFAAQLRHSLDGHVRDRAERPGAGFHTGGYAGPEQTFEAEVDALEANRCTSCPWPAGTDCGGAYGVCEGNARDPQHLEELAAKVRAAASAEPRQPWATDDGVCRPTPDTECGLPPGHQGNHCPPDEVVDADIVDPASDVGAPRQDFAGAPTPTDVAETRCPDPARVGCARPGDHLFSNSGGPCSPTRFASDRQAAS